MASSSCQSMFALAALLALLVSPVDAAGPNEAWEDIVALDAGPKETPRNALEGRRIAAEHFGKQEKALRAFLKQYPGDERRVEARLRLARVLQLRADVQDGKIASAEIEMLIREAEKIAKPE